MGVSEQFQKDRACLIRIVVEARNELELRPPSKRRQGKLGAQLVGVGLLEDSDVDWEQMKPAMDEYFSGIFWCRWMIPPKPPKYRGAVFALVERLEGIAEDKALQEEVREAIRVKQLAKQLPRTPLKHLAVEKLIDTRKVSRLSDARGS